MEFPLPDVPDQMAARTAAESCSSTLLHQRCVGCFHRHPHHRLGARGTQDQAALALQRCLGMQPGGLHAGASNGLRIGGDAHVDGLLRQRLVVGQRRAQRPALPDQHFQHLQCRDDGVAGAGAVQAQQVAGGFAAQHAVALDQRLVHVTVANLGAHELDAAARRALSPARSWSSACRPPGRAGGRCPASRGPADRSGASPSSRRPSLSTISTRSPSPSKAMPRSAPVSRTWRDDRLRVRRADAPLMFSPSGFTPIA